MSLIDVVISIAILLVLMTFSAVSIANAVQLNDAMKSQDRSMRAPILRMRRELQLAFLTKDLTAAETYQTVFVGQDNDPDMLWFATRAHQRLYRDARESDQAEITIWAEAMPRTEEYDDEGYVIYHREAPRIDEEPGKGGTVHPIAYNVRSFELRYLDGRTNEWKDEWDSRSADNLNLLPRAVEISMVLLYPDPRRDGDWIEKPHKTSVVLEFADPVVQQKANTEFK
jgi:general secretion pathway protein J